MVKAGGGGATAGEGDHAHDAAASATGAHAMTTDEMDAAIEKSIRAFPAKTQGVGAQDLAPCNLADGTKQFELPPRSSSGRSSRASSSTP